MAVQIHSLWAPPAAVTAVVATPLPTQSHSVKRRAGSAVQLPGPVTQPTMSAVCPMWQACCLPALHLCPPSLPSVSATCCLSAAAVLLCAIPQLSLFLVLVLVPLVCAYAELPLPFSLLLRHMSVLKVLLHASTYLHDSFSGVNLAQPQVEWLLAGTCNNPVVSFKPLCLIWTFLSMDITKADLIISPSSEGQPRQHPGLYGWKQRLPELPSSACPYSFLAQRLAPAQCITQKANERSHNRIGSATVHPAACMQTKVLREPHTR